MKINKVLAVLFAISITLFGCSESSDSKAKSSDTKEEKKTEKKVDEKVKLTVNSAGDWVSDDDFDQPAEGNKFVLIDFTIENISAEKGIETNPFYFQIESDTSIYSTAAFVLSSQVTISGDVTLKPGGSGTYTIAFEIPEGETVTKLSYDNFDYSVSVSVK